MAAAAVELAESYREEGIYPFIALSWAWTFMSNPTTRPKNMAKSLEASRRIASGG